jgi:SAM-dependent methyltransferase
MKNNKHREILYTRYHSTFNSLISSADEKTLKSLFAHYDYKILPLLKNFSSSAKILELGCGPGYLLEYLKSKGFDNILGIDISKEQVEIAVAKGLRAVEGDVFDFLRSNSEKYDLIFAFDFIEHFTKDELIELTNLIYQNLKDGGVLIIRTPNGEGIFAGYVIYGDLTHQTIFTPNSLVQLLKLVGFKRVYCFENGPVAKDIKGLLRKIVWEIFKMIINVFRISEVGGRMKIISQDFYGVSYK